MYVYVYGDIMFLAKYLVDKAIGNCIFKSGDPKMSHRRWSIDNTNVINLP